MVVVYCYVRKVFTSRVSARRFYREAIFNSDGGEQQRYENVLDDIERGFDICWDQLTKMPDDDKEKYVKQFKVGE